MQTSLNTKFPGGGLFRVSESGGTFYVNKVTPGFLGDSTKDIGQTRSLEDAITLIRSYSGKDIKKISDW